MEGRSRSTEGLRRTLVTAWLAVAAIAALSLPAHNGSVETAGRVPFALFDVLVAAFAWTFVRATAPSRTRALAGSVAPLLLLAAAAGLAYRLNRDASEFRGEPLLLYLGAALVVSWCVLVFASAVLARTQWSRPAGLAATLLVAGLAFAQMVARLD